MLITLGLLRVAKVQTRRVCRSGIGPTSSSIVPSIRRRQLLVGWISPHGIFREREVNLANECSVNPAPGDSCATRKAQKSRAVPDAVLKTALELIAVRGARFGKKIRLEQINVHEPGVGGSADSTERPAALDCILYIGGMLPTTLTTRRSRCAGFAFGAMAWVDLP